MKTYKFLRIKSLFLAIALFITYQFNGLAGNNDLEIKSMSYKAYLTTSKTIWEEIIKKCEIKFQSSNGDYECLLALANAQYGLLNICLANQDKNTFNKFIEGAEENMNLLLEKGSEISATHSLISAIYGAKMGFYPMKGMFLGPKSNEHMNKALSLDKDNAQAYRVKASSKFFTPEMFGGSIDESIELYEKAIELYEAQNNIEENWEYIDCIAWLGIAYQKLENNDKAIQAYNKALKVEPNFSWVKHVLLPQALKSAEK